MHDQVIHSHQGGYGYCDLYGPLTSSYPPTHPAPPRPAPQACSRRGAARLPRPRCSSAAWSWRRRGRASCTPTCSSSWTARRRSRGARASSKLTRAVQGAGQQSHVYICLQTGPLGPAPSVRCNGRDVDCDGASPLAGAHRRQRRPAAAGWPGQVSRGRWPGPRPACAIGSSGAASRCPASRYSRVQQQ